LKSGKNDGKLTNAKKDISKIRVSTKQAKNRESTHCQFFTTIFEEDGSIRYVDDRGNSSVTSSDDDLKSAKSDNASSKVDVPAKKPVLRKKKYTSSMRKTGTLKTKK